MKPADRIIGRFGGLHALAKALGHRHVTTVQGWKERGYVPGKQIPAVLRAARNLNIEITLKDFDDLEAGADRAAANDTGAPSAAKVDRGDDQTKAA